MLAHLYLILAALQIAAVYSWHAAAVLQQVMSQLTAIANR